jgi:ATP-dependent helicase/nuclease subunit B
MSGRGLFAGAGPRVWAAPATAPFLRLLARRLLDDLTDPDNPFALAESLILTPNRRSARALIDAFAQEAGEALLLPAIRPLGDLDDDPEVWGPAALTFAAPEAIDPLRRRFELARLLRARDAASGGAEDPVHALAGADELAALLDAAAAAELSDWAALGTLVGERNLAGHWALSVRFLKIIGEYWPQRLAADGLADPGARRTHLLTALADLWRDKPPSSPVIIAGSTGSLPAVRRLMAVVAELPRGCVVLPGLDTDLDDAAWDAIGPQHPQATLKATLSVFGLNRRAVPVVPGFAESPVGKARRALIREALAPADVTADWLARLEEIGGVAVLGQGAAGLARMDCRTEDEEASVCALLLREALDTPGRTAALVTPSLSLARRVAGKLARYGLDVPVAPGPPLVETDVGRLLRTLSDLVADDADPVALAALIRHPRVRLAGGGEALIRAHLNGSRRFANLAALVAAAEGEAQIAATALATALNPLRAPGIETLPAFAEAIGLAAEALCGGADAVWIGPDGETAIRALHQLRGEGDGLGALTAEEAARVLADAFARAPAPAMLAPEHPRLAILGPLEARLQTRDLLVLGGLNEGVWPQPPKEDTFLSRPMRTALGLASPDQRIGQAAHDFAQFACAPEVVLTRAERQGDQPSVASRWLWRLEALLKAGGIAALDRPGPDLRAVAAALAQPAQRRPAPAPRPRLNPGETIARVSFTAAENLIRDPYGFYARHILGLTVSRPVGAERDARERGTALHLGIERFCKAGGGDGGALLDELERAHREAGLAMARLPIERARLTAAAEAFAAWHMQRLADGAFAHVEIKGAMRMDVDADLHGKADRIDVFGDGRIAIVDVKSGGKPTAAQAISGIAPQLALEAATVLEGGFGPVAGRNIDQIGYFRFRRGDSRFEPLDYKDGPVAAAAAALAGLQKLIRQYTDDRLPFLSRPRPTFMNEAGDYDRLARRAEWADSEAEE